MCIGQTLTAQEIVGATGCLPLAIKWAASLAVSSNSLVEASRKIRTTDATKKEFLNFCFKTMFDELSELAKDVATLSPFLGEEWRVPTLSVALDRSEEEIQSAVTELRDRGIILAQTERVDEAMRLLPMTLDFLANKWHESSALSDAVNSRLADAVGSEHADGLLINWPYAKRIEVVIRRITELRTSKDYPRALKLISLAKTWNETIRDPHVNFLEGELTYLSHHWTGGIALMKRALENADPEVQLGREKWVLADALTRHGVKADEHLAATLYAEALPTRETIETPLMRKAMKLMLRQPDLGALIEFISNLEKGNACFNAMRILVEVADKDNSLPYRIGTPYTRLLRLAATSEMAQSADRALLLAQAEEYEKKFSTIGDPRVKEQRK
jgi:hypothetical protein